MSDIQFHTPSSDADTLSNAVYVDTPRGIFAPKSGLQFRLSEAKLQSRVGALLEKTSLGELIGMTEIWMRSAHSLALWVLPLMLLLLPGVLGLYPAALIVALLVWYFWELSGAKFASLGLTKLFKILDHALLQFAINAFAWGALLNWYRMTKQIGTWEGVIIGVIGFVILKFQVLAKLFPTWIDKGRGERYPQPYPDQILTRLLHQKAIAAQTDVAEAAALAEGK